MQEQQGGKQKSRPPVLVGERAVWLGSGSGLPQGGIVRWIGKLPGMGPGWTLGLELDRALPYGGIDGTWCGRKLFQCQTKHGLLVPAAAIVREDALLRTFGISPAALSKNQPQPPSSDAQPLPSPKPPKRASVEANTKSLPQRAPSDSPLPKRPSSEAINSLPQRPSRENRQLTPKHSFSAVDPLPRRPGSKSRPAPKPPVSQSKTHSKESINESKTASKESVNGNKPPIREPKPPRKKSVPEPKSLSEEVSIDNAGETKSPPKKPAREPKISNGDLSISNAKSSLVQSSLVEVKSTSETLVEKPESKAEQLITVATPISEKTSIEPGAASSKQLVDKPIPTSEANSLPEKTSVESSGALSEQLVVASIPNPEVNSISEKNSIESSTSSNKQLVVETVLINEVNSLSEKTSIESSSKNLFVESISIPEVNSVSEKKSLESSSISNEQIVVGSIPILDQENSKKSNASELIVNEVKPVSELSLVKASPVPERRVRKAHVVLDQSVRESKLKPDLPVSETKITKESSLDNSTPTQPKVETKAPAQSPSSESLELSENSSPSLERQDSLPPLPPNSSAKQPFQPSGEHKRHARGVHAPGYFHTAPARPSRHVKVPKQASALPSTPDSAEVEPSSENTPQSSSLPHPSPNKDNAEPAWSPLVASSERRTPPRVPLRRHNSLNQPRSSDLARESSSEPVSITDELIYQWFDANENPPTAPPRHARPQPPMNSNSNDSSSVSSISSSSSFEDALAAADAIYSERFKKHFSVESASSISSTSSSNRKSGGFLSFLRWLRRGGGSDSGDEKVTELSHAGSTNSVGTAISAASSFAYIGPTAYQLQDNRASLHYAHSPADSETYKYRIKQRDHARQLDKNLTLRRKYKLKQFACSQETVASETLKPSQKPSTGSSGRSRKRRAPPIPTQKNEHYSDYSLPASLEHRSRRMDTDDADAPGAVKLHRRTASESAKDKRAGAYCHVKGKRRAPPPPGSSHNRPSSALTSKFKSPFPSFGRKKRQAPPPPSDDSEEIIMSNAEKQRLISNINKLKAHAAQKADRPASNSENLQGPALVTSPPVVLSAVDDALRLQEGDVPPNKPEPVMAKAPLSPKPWYKRSSSKVTKVDKRSKKDEEEMPEFGYARVMPNPEEGKRKSLQLTMLPSISELDRQAAEIVQQNREREAAKILARDNSFYSTPQKSPSPETPPPTTPESPQPKANAKGLISMFNAITNVSKVKVNTSTAAIAGFFSGESRKNRMSQTFTVVEEHESEEIIDIKITESSTPDVEIEAQKDTKAVTLNEDIKIISVSQATAKKDISESKSSESSQAVDPSAKETVSAPQKNDSSSPSAVPKVKLTETSNVSAVKKSLYPPLSITETEKEAPPPIVPSGASEVTQRQRRIVWTCPRCTLENPRWRLTCDACDMWRPSSTHEETVLHAVKNLHTEPSKPEAIETKTKANQQEDIDELKPPEPIGPIDWESELKKYFDPNIKDVAAKKADNTNNVDLKKPGSSSMTTPISPLKVEEAIKILEGKKPTDISKPALKIAPDAKAESSNAIKEEIKEISNTKNAQKIPVYAPVKGPETKNSQSNVTKLAEKLSNPKVNAPVKLPEPKRVSGGNKLSDKVPLKKETVPVKMPETFFGGQTKAEDKKVVENGHGKITENKTPVKVSEAVKVPSNFIGGRTKLDDQKNTKISTGTETKPPDEEPPVQLTKEDIGEVRKARLAFFNKPQSSLEGTTDAKPPASPRLTRKKSAGTDIPESPLLSRAKKAESGESKELFQKVPDISPRLLRNKKLDSSNIREPLSQKVQTALDSPKYAIAKRADPTEKKEQTPTKVTTAPVASSSSPILKKSESTTTSDLPQKVISTPDSPKISNAKKSNNAQTTKDAQIISESSQSSRLSKTEGTDTYELLQKLAISAIGSPAVSTADREEKLKLREKLKELKNSLTRHPKPSGASETEKEQPPSPTDKEIAQGAIRKTSHPSNNAADSSTNKIEVTTENIRVKKQIINRPTKVSSSAQTSGAIVSRKSIAEDSKNIKGGKVYTALSRNPSFRGTGTFELMGAKDFATIEATKSDKKTASGVAVQHVYANIPSPGLVQDSAKPKGKLPPPPALPPKMVQQSVVVEVATKEESEEDDDEDEEEEEVTSRDDQSSASGAADSAVSISGSVGDSSDVEKLAGQLTRPKGLADFKADLAASPPQQKSNTLAVNRLLRQLEGAIANGQHRQAAGLAKDLARLKITCSVTRHRKNLVEPELFIVDMYVEDKISHQGPIPLSVYASMTVGELKAKVQQDFEIPATVQRWILGKQLAQDETKTLQQHSVAAAGCTVFLYLVAPPERAESSSPATEPSAPVMTPPPPEEPVQVSTVEPPRGPGWYFNYEEDRYSYCESSDEDASDPEDELPVQTQKAPEAVLQSLAPIEVVVPNVRAPSPIAPIVVPEEAEEESSSEEEEEGEEEVVVGSLLLPTAPPPENRTGTLMLGWRCPVCTLVNSPTRPGCAACTTERPTNYHIPQHYEASEQEAQRLKREAETEVELNEDGEGAHAGNGVDHYQALVALDNTDLVASVEGFECPVCMTPCAPGEGAMLRECLHAFCRPCLAKTAQFNEEDQVRCPFRNQQYACEATLQDREVRALLPPDEYEKLQAKCVALAENKIKNAFHCKTPDCPGWCIFEDNVNDFACPVCGHHNCMTCQSIHDGLNCRQYQERVTQASETDAEARRTKEMLEEMVARGEALCCPTCKVILMKKWGCDWLRCSMCKTEICWVTRGPRWGPGGKGDTTGGCKCGINGVKCHPKCNYCH